VDGFVTRQTPMIIFKQRGTTFEKIQALVQHLAVPNDMIVAALYDAGFTRVSWFFPSQEQLGRHIFMKNRAFFTAEK